MSRRKRRQKQSQDLQGKIYIFVGIIVVAVIATLYVQSQSQLIRRDKLTLCRVDGVTSSDNVILIDSTDSLNQTQSIQVKKEIYNIVENSEQDSKFSLYFIEETTQNVQPLIEVCNPGDGQELSELTNNKRRLLKKWKLGFLDKLTSELDPLLTAPVANKSPIMETIKVSAVQSLYGEKQLKNLIIVSDLLQHSDNYSQYQANSSWDQFSKLPVASSLAPELSNTNVNVLYLYRQKNSNLQNRAHVKFWEEFITSSGGFLTRVKRIN